MTKEKDYSKTIFLPKCEEFPMRGNLPLLEEKILKYWDEINIYEEINKNKTKKPFIFHHGPPYVSGNFHLGHFVSMSLKDFIVRYKSMLGYPVPVMQGHDCHGLPIELKVQEELKLKNENIKNYSINKFIGDCRAYGEKWSKIHKEQTKRIGVVTNTKKFYSTMDKETEYKTYKIFSDLVMNNKVYMDRKPMFWSIAEQSTVAEIEVTYKKQITTSVYVALKFVGNLPEFLKDSGIIIWTTTPWTLVSNLAVAYGKDIEYSGILINGQKFFVSSNLLNNLVEEFRDTNGYEVEILYDTLKGSDFEGTMVEHPMIEDKTSPMILGHHVMEEEGTGFVHTSPDHGEDDFYLGKEYELGLCDYVDEEGYYREHTPLLANKHIFKDKEYIMSLLHLNKKLVAKKEIEHSYPYSDRTNCPLIYRCTEQIFIKTVESNEEFLENIDNVTWLPQTAENRIKSFVKNRKNDWCVSRQRIWGIPMMIFVHKNTGEVLKDEETQKIILNEISLRGIDHLLSIDWTIFLREELLNSYRPVYGVLDVWFDSGATFNTCLPELYNNNGSLKEQQQADLYLEGSDQHRGWFQSSLILSTLLNKQAPYKNVLTHGFVVDEKGMKMSKSKKNGISFDEILNNGIDVARILVISADYYSEIKVGLNLFEEKKEIYRKIRNILRYLYGATKDITKKEKEYIIRDSDILEQYILEKAFLLQEYIIEQSNLYNMKGIFESIFRFIQDLSIFYLDIKKDILYCDEINSQSRQATRKTQYILLEFLLRILSPIIPFTVEEIALLMNYKTIHNQSIVYLKKEKNYEKNYDLVTKIRDFIIPIKIDIEKARGEKIINSNNEANVFAPIPDEFIEHINLLKEILMVSNIENNTTIEIKKSNFKKCNRCWKYDSSVDEQDICNRCDKVVNSN